MKEQRKEKNGLYSRDELENIIKKYGDSIYRLAYLKMKNKDKADDIYQNVFLKLIKQDNRIEPEEHLKAWLMRTTVNCCKDYWKSSWHRKVSYEEKEPDAGNGQENGYLTELVQDMPEKYRTVIHLFYYEGYSIKEIALMLGKKENTIASQLSRGRECLKGMLSEKEIRGYGF